MKKENIIDILKTIYDPEVPILDIYNMGIVYDVNIKDKKVDIIMTFTSPQCPMWDMIIEMVNNSITERFPDANVNIEITFDPIWSPDMIKDEDIKQMFVWEIG